MTTSTPAHTAPSRPWALRQAGRVVDVVDRRITTSRWARRNSRRAFPSHWSFWLGHIALFSFVIVLASGVFLALWFEPSMAPVRYDGVYAPLQGVLVSEAYASTLEISFEVRGGLLMRQIHYWATHVFIAAMAVHLLRVFFTGGFRKPRTLNWLIGLALLVLGIVAAYTGHGLPDDLLSGTGLRIVEGGILGIPIVGTGLSWLIFGGEYPGEDIVTRLYVVHLVISVLIVALLVAHLALVRRQRHTQWGGAGTTNRHIVGSRHTVHAARASGFMLIVVGFIVVMAATVQINPVWLSGPYDPSQAGAGARPDWYMGFLDGAFRLMPPWEITVFGHELLLGVIIPVVVLPGVIITALAIYPWVEQKITGVDTDQNILDRPRTMPVRTGLGVGFIVFYLLLWIAGGNDAIATVLHVPVNWLTRFLQVGVIVLPPLAYSITTRICLGLQRRDRDKVRHGLETGVTFVDPGGGFSEVHHRLGADAAAALVPPERPTVPEPGPAFDENGIPAPRRRRASLRARLVRSYYGDEESPR